MSGPVDWGSGEVRGSDRSDLTRAAAEVVRPEIEKATVGTKPYGRPRQAPDVSARTKPRDGAPDEAAAPAWLKHFKSPIDVGSTSLWSR